MPKEFLKPLLWAIGLHGGVLGILIFSWPILSQSVFSFDQYRIFKVSLISPQLASFPVAGETQKNISSRRVENQKNSPPHSVSNRSVPESVPSFGENPNPAGEDQGLKKESGLGTALSPQINQPENIGRGNGHGGQNPPSGNNKELLVSFSPANKSVAGSTFAVPRYGLNREPHYPTAAREQGWQGTALLKVLVLKNGSVGHLEILRSSGYAILDRSALKAVKDWKFVPAQKDGQPIEIGVEVPVTFRLE